MPVSANPFRFEAELRDNNATVELRLPAKVQIDADEALLFAQALGEIRKRMHPSIAAHSPAERPGPVDIVMAPPFGGFTDEERGMSALSIRHPGFGWLHFEFEPELALHLATALSAAANQLIARRGKATRQ